MLTVYFLITLCVPGVLAAPLDTRQAADPSTTPSANSDSASSAYDFAAALAELQSTYEKIEGEALRTHLAQQGETLTASHQVRERESTPKKSSKSTFCFLSLHLSLSHLIV